MRKIPTVFMRDYSDGKRGLVRNEVTAGCEWVLNGEGVATIKYDGTCCLIEDGVLFKRYDRKLTKANNRKFKQGKIEIITEDMLKPAPKGWRPAQETFDPKTGHFPGWLRVDFEKPENRWHEEAWSYMHSLTYWRPENGTYELVGEKVQGNPHDIEGHELWRHSTGKVELSARDFDTLKKISGEINIEGFVFHHEGGRMAKIKRSDFGFEYPVKTS